MMERLAHIGWNEVLVVPELGVCHEWRGATMSNGYGVVGRSDGSNVGAHRASFEVHIGPIPPRMLACHRCDNPPCINPAHLFLGSHKNNSQDMVIKGRHGRSSARLSDSQASEVRALHALGNVTHLQLAEKFGISRSKITNIVNRKSYRHVA